MTALVVVVNDDWYKKLDPQLRAAVTKADAEAQLACAGVGAVQDALAIAELAKNGMTVYAPSPDEMAKFRQTTVAPTRAWAEKQFGSELVSEILRQPDEVIPRHAGRRIGPRDRPGARHTVTIDRRPPEFVPITAVTSNGVCPRVRRSAASARLVPGGRPARPHAGRRRRAGARPLRLRDPDLRRDEFVRYAMFYMVMLPAPPWRSETIGTRA